VRFKLKGGNNSGLLQPVEAQKTPVLKGYSSCFPKTENPSSDIVALANYSGKSPPRLFSLLKNLSL